MKKAGFFLFFVLMASSVLAQEEKKPLAIESSRVNYETERAEVCLSFDRDVAFPDRENVLSLLRLEKAKARVAVNERDLSLSSRELCVQKLQHRHTYRLTLGKIRMKDGAFLEKSFSLSFAVPDRKATLSLASSAKGRGFPRYMEQQTGTAISIQAVNVPKTRLTLYKISDPSFFASAWAQYVQSGLAPSESLYFASHNGQQVWQTELVFNDEPNIEHSMTVPLPKDGKLGAGLYFLAAMPPTSTARPSLLAGQWFIASDLRLVAVFSPEGVRVFASNAKADGALADVGLRLTGKDGNLIVEGKTDGMGTAFLPVAADKKADIALLSGVTTKGDVDVFDATEAESTFVPLPLQAEMVPDRNLYQPGSVATVALSARDVFGHPQKIENSALKLLRPDQSFYSEVQVPSDKTGVFFLQVPVPASSESGAWNLLWQRADGKILAKKPLQINEDLSGAKIEVTADRLQLETDGFIHFTIKARDSHNRPLAWRTGRITGKQVRLTLPTLEKYTFGNANANAASKSVDFMTGVDGVAQVDFKMPLTGEALTARAVSFEAQLEDAATPVELKFPVKAQSGWIGVRPLTDESVFAENSAASFGIVGVDSEGHRKAFGDLYFQIYEEGRNFDWYQDEGRWGYKPLPQHRRVGGGPLALNATADTVVRWPVTAGHYVMEITNRDGVSLAQYSFNTGWSQISSKERKAEKEIVFAKSGETLVPDQENKLRIKLDRPAMVNIVAGDDRVHQTLYKFMPAGENVFALSPTKVWGERIQVIAQATFADGDISRAQQIFPVRHGRKEMNIDFTALSPVVTGAALTVPVIVSGLEDKKPVFVGALATPMPADGATAPSSMVLPAKPVEKDGRVQMRFELPEFLGKVRLTFFAWDEKQIASKQTTIAAQPIVESEAIVPENMSVGDRAVFALRVKNNVGAQGKYTYKLTVPDGLKMEGAAKGTLVLKHGQERVLLSSLAGTKPMRDVLRLELSGPSGFQATRVWPINVLSDKPAELSLTEKKVEAQKSLKIEGPVFVSAAPLLGLPGQIGAVLNAEPVTTEEIAAWLETTKLAQADITALGFMDERNLKSLRAGRLKRLQERQNDDGGFASGPVEGASEIESTAAVIVALQEEAPYAASLAVGWLQRKLENTWFEETERPARAKAFLALSSVGRVDLSGLRYFADTSREKELAPYVAARVALALAQAKDDEAARYWLQRARGTLDAKSTDIWSLLLALAANPLQDLREVSGDVQKVDRPSSLKDMMKAVRIVKTLQKRTGSRMVAVNGTEKKIGDTYRLEKGTVEIVNRASDEIYVLQVAPQAAKGAKGETGLVLRQDIYALDGTLLDTDAALERGKTYLLLTQGTVKNKALLKTKALVTVPFAAGVVPVVFSGARTDSFVQHLSWLPMALTPVNDAMVSDLGTSFALPETEAWTVACLVKAVYDGSYKATTSVLRPAEGAPSEVTQNKLRLRISAR